MKILTVSGSARIQSSNLRLLQHCEDILDQHEFKYADYLKDVPLFIDGRSSDHESLDKLRNDIQWSDALIISTPEYLANIPALLKNAFEWVSASGELDNKKVLAIVYTPVEPRGDKAMLSLSSTLSALNCQTCATINLYQTDLVWEYKMRIINKESYEMLLEALNLLVGT